MNVNDLVAQLKLRVFEPGKKSMRMGVDGFKPGNQDNIQLHGCNR